MTDSPATLQPIPAIAPDAAPSADAAASDKVAETILQGIRAGTFATGQHLVEPDLMRRLGISRGSLREALKRLASEGIVTLTRFRGAYISAFDRKTVFDLLQMLEPLFCLAGRLAAEHCDTPEKVAQVMKVTADIEEAARHHNRAVYMQQRRNFYAVLIEVGGNRELSRAMPMARTELFRAQIESALSERQRQMHAGGYLRIAKAVVERNPATAERAMRKHFASTHKIISELPDHAFSTSI
ncbi:GntR family transcriptional regulator [Novosphingobium rosa]|uniref:GntR family transcriptional regulator n=1 Tax=Novosphingobium rosa TaxID=76978 RepID=UPI000832A885|nr:GntR family transcriptional regulator [Novosphingobium rosa]